MALGSAVAGLRLGPEGGRVRLPGPLYLSEEASRRKVHQSDMRRARQAGHVSQRDTVRSTLKPLGRDISVSYGCR